jgi:hypothetical protein
MNTTTDTARDYCQLIGRELDALELVLETGLDIENDQTAGEYAEAINELGADIEQDPYDIVSQWLNETILELKILRTDNRNSTRVEMLRTCGGPRCDITRDSDDGLIISITTYSGTDQATTRNSYPELANYLDELAQ